MPGQVRDLRLGRLGRADVEREAGDHAAGQALLDHVHPAAVGIEAIERGAVGGLVRGQPAG
jgi:hypothetical protein